MKPNSFGRACKQYSCAKEDFADSESVGGRKGKERDEKDRHGSRLALKWFNRFDNTSLDGRNIKHRSGRPLELPLNRCIKRIQTNNQYNGFT